VSIAKDADRKRAFFDPTSFSSMERPINGNLEEATSPR
jgi:hypothetical protein